MAGSLPQRIVRAMGLFGGTQLAVIALGILRNKFLALWLGPAGVGLNAIFISTQDLVTSAAGLNLRAGGVRELSAAPPGARQRMAGVVLRTAAFLAACGGALMLLLSGAFSLWSLGEASHWWWFALLAIGAAAAIRLDADMAILQAEGHIRALARVTLVAAATATAAAIPLYRLLRIEAVLPVYLLMTLTYAAWAARERRRCCRPPTRTGLRNALRHAGPMLRLGAYLTLAVVAERLAGYLFVVFLSREASESVLGLYQAGYTMVCSYVTVVLTAISAEYYPRLAAVASSRLRMQTFARGEVKVAVWLLTPAVVAFVCVSGPVTRMLYSEEFMAAVPYLDLGVCGILPRAYAFSMAYVILARGEGRAYALTLAAGAAAGLALRVGGYLTLGFAGLGAACVAEYALCGLMAALACRRYGIDAGRAATVLTACATALCVGAVAAKAAFGWWVPAAAVLPWLVPLAARQVLPRRRSAKRC